ncbi:similar to Saccharomyces cerevisiae YCL061C MRC1 S-phase checkpoint protein required for DNA replication [Maudiozyma saulgeensis]|uniref:Similar to Saccharomyces cerevisiae YCL061C MRC1 S-phase checkpoint protein required for DNA replication n=1 Tax=Maudiozyma saulgeensis TaxID=1789683 RepID=A0A1X7R320_9SACH|nr:similar to Saccharomyces cerevisiae YCL061C MRC1 S-phase checkpoint protein required for DNA replication [Kazachstania saulgeensis]
MDFLLDSLLPIKKKKRTTYQKVTSTNPENAEALTVSGSGFLFDNEAMNKIKTRLDDGDEEQEDTEESTHEVNKSEALFPSQTQLISQLYEGGEDLEERRDTQVIERPSVQKGEDRSAVNMSGKSTQLTIEQHEYMEVDEDQISLSQTQVIKSIPKNKENDNNNNMGDIDDLATQLIVPHDDSDEEDTTDYQGTENVNNENILNFTQNFNKSLFNPFDETNEIIISENNANVTKLIAETQQISNISETQIISYGNEEPDIAYTAETQKIKDNVATQEEDQPEEIEKELENGYPKTQADEDMMNTQPIETETQIDHPKLKIHGIQKMLEEEDKQREKAKMVEYKRPIKKTVVKLNFSKDDFLADFDDSDGESSDTSVKEELKMIERKPINMEEQFEKELDEFEDSGNVNKTNEEEEFESKPTTELENRPPFHITGLINYETELKKEIHSDQYINLEDDSSDSDSSQLKPSHASKASLLNIRVRLSKNATLKKKLQQTKSTPNKLFNSLMQANQKQILEHRKGIIEAKGLDISMIEKEKDIVENLLEQEILRNKKIRKREKEQEEMIDAEGEMDFDYSDNELEGSDVTDNEGSINQEDGNIDSAAMDTNGLDYSSDNNDEVDVVALDKEDDDDIIPSKKSKKMKALHIVGVEESDDDDNHPEPVEISKKNDANTDDEILSSERNAIDLGHYGSNLDRPNTQDNEIGFSKNNNDEADDLEEDDTEVRMEFIKHEKKKQLEHERKLQKKRDELKKKGVSNFVEEEAEESDDEWFGVGGADGEGIEDYDSEVEKMIDDYSKANFDPDEIRQMIAQEKKDADMKMVEKILFDLKNGGLKKRGRSDFDLELSDEEDDDLRQYRIKRRELMKQRRLDLGEDKLVQNPRSKAFFESMVEDIEDAKNPFGNSEVVDDTQSTTTNGETQEIPEKDSSESPEADSKIGDISKKFTLSEDFVHRSLSFLNETNKDVAEIENDRKLARIQHGKDIDDLNTLKKQSSIKSFKSIHSSQSSIVDLASDDTQSESNHTRNHGQFDHDEGISRFRNPSILKLFGSKTDVNDKFREGTKSVKVTNSYRTVGGNKSSITYMGKNRKLVPPKKKNRGFLIGSDRRSKLNQLFNSHTDSFE